MTHLNKIIIATGIYLQENNSCIPADIQNMVVKHFDEIRLPLKEVQDGLDILVLGNFLVKVGTGYHKQKISIIYTSVETHKEQDSNSHLGQALWNMDVL